mmetsp:Transcript_2752/g.4095  ORF Transcript_2752/g.4095 Transcript_2752/m.4095 type:complete len:121 (+) Transcript_2752:8-370(+)
MIDGRWSMVDSLRSHNAIATTKQTTTSLNNNSDGSQHYKNIRFRMKIFSLTILLLEVMAYSYACHDDCLLPVEVGPCRASLPRYAFDGQKCELFTYGGCKGNSNNFQQLSECEQTCQDCV